MIPRELRQRLAFLEATPLHPQWLMRGVKEKFLKSVSPSLRGRVLDIGCAGGSSRACLNDGVEYIGLDYYTTAAMYGSRPAVFAMAENLPFPAASMDGILLLDVLEHVRDPDACMGEVERVLAPGGRLVLNVPFMYPLHDVPHDYQRWTRHGLHSLLARHSLAVESEAACGHPLITSGLLLNLALCRTAITGLQRRSPAALLIILLPVLVTLINLMAGFTGWIASQDDFMPYRYHFSAIKR